MPTENIMEKMMRVYLRLMRAEMGALPRAPKNAPAWRTETAFEVMAFFLAVPPLKPKCSWK